MAFLFSAGGGNSGLNVAGAALHILYREPVPNLILASDGLLTLSVGIPALVVATIFCCPAADTDPKIYPESGGVPFCSNPGIQCEHGNLIRF